MELTLLERWALGLVVVSLGSGHFIIEYGLRLLRQYIVKQKSLGQLGIPAPVVGAVERLFFTPAVAYYGGWAVAAMIPWIVFKMKITWGEVNRPLLPYPTTSLLGSLLSMFFALVGGLICRG